MRSMKSLFAGFLNCLRDLTVSYWISSADLYDVRVAFWTPHRASSFGNTEGDTAKFRQIDKAECFVTPNGALRKSRYFATDRRWRRMFWLCAHAGICCVVWFSCPKRPLTTDAVPLNCLLAFVFASTAVIEFSKCYDCHEPNTHKLSGKTIAECCQYYFCLLSWCLWILKVLTG